MIRTGIAEILNYFKVDHNIKLISRFKEEKEKGLSNMEKQVKTRARKKKE